VRIDQLVARDNIPVMTNVDTRQVIAEHGRVVGIEYEDRATGDVKQDELAGVFIQIGLVPNSQVVADLVETKPWGEIVINEKCETSEPGIYACGDVTTVPYKQINIAMGEGSKASLAAFEYLLTHEVGAEDGALAA
jgi:alkyl hydroperoxide reductase subunit F